MPARLRTPSWFALLAPGLLVAATGVGAGDLLTGALAGSHVGLAVLWAAWLGAVCKWTLNEGIARWQMGTGTPLLEGWVRYLGTPLYVFFLVYLLLWSVVVGGALVSACGVAGTAFWSWGEPEWSKRIWGVFHSLLGLGLIWWGGFRWFERLMACCVAAMFAVVLLTALWMPGVDWAAALRGLLPRVPPPQGLGWTLGVLGGVGGTVTLLSYGYWIAHHDRQGRRGLRVCQIDLAAGYTMTGLFGMAMVVIGSRFRLPEAKDPLLALELAQLIQQAVGPWGRWLFQLGFWAAVFSSLLGVWQSVPYLFAHLIYLRRRERGRLNATAVEQLETTAEYRGYLLFLATVPCLLLGWRVQGVQLLYAVLGALFMPLLAATLLVLNNRPGLVGRELKNPWWINLGLLGVLVLFAFLGIRSLIR